jgi:arsenate reductase-like glutaredoxin family protein
MGLTLYIKPSWPWCVEAVAWLEERRYALDKINVLSDPMAYGHMRCISKQSLTRHWKHRRAWSWQILMSPSLRISC